MHSYNTIQYTIILKKNYYNFQFLEFALANHKEYPDGRLFQWSTNLVCKIKHSHVIFKTTSEVTNHCL